MHNEWDRRKQTESKKKETKGEGIKKTNFIMILRGYLDLHFELRVAAVAERAPRSTHNLSILLL